MDLIPNPTHHRIHNMHPQRILLSFAPPKDIIDICTDTYTMIYGDEYRFVPSSISSIEWGFVVFTFMVHPFLLMFLLISLVFIYILAFTSVLDILTFSM